jgi:hypothetical protein
MQTEGREGRSCGSPSASSADIDSAPFELVTLGGPLARGPAHLQQLAQQHQHLARAASHSR